MLKITLMISLSRYLIGAMVLSLVCGLSQPAHASLLGDEFSAQYFYPDDFTPYPSASGPFSFVAGSTSAIINVEGVTNITVSGSANTIGIEFATTLTYPTWDGAASFNGIKLTPANPGILSGLQFAVSSLNFGFNNSRLSITPTSINFDFGGLSYETGSRVTASLVPLPAALPLLGSALLGMGGLAWRHRRSAIASDATVLEG